MTREELIKYRDRLIDYIMKGKIEFCYEGGAHMSTEQYKRRKIYRNVIVYQLDMNKAKKRQIAQEVRRLDMLIGCQTEISNTQYRDHETT